MARVQRWVSCQVKQKGLFLEMRLVFENRPTGAGCRRQPSIHKRGLGIRDADKSRADETSQKVANRVSETLARTPTCSHKSPLS